MKTTFTVNHDDQPNDVIDKFIEALKEIGVTVKVDYPEDIPVGNVEIEKTDNS